MKKSAIRILVSSLLVFVFVMPSYSKEVYILCYHAFLEKKNQYTFAPDQFREQLNRLKNNGFNFVTFEDIINNRITGNNNVLISIDDGNHSVYDVYRTILKPMGIKPLLGIYPAIISRVNYAMTWEQVKELSADGCYIASHGYHHMFLSEKYYKDEPESFKKEIYLSKKILEEKLNRKIETMIYPFGVNSDIAISELKNAGYKYGMTIVPGMNSLPVSDNFHFRRYLMSKSEQKGIIALITKKAGRTASENSRSSAKASDIKSKKFNGKRKDNKSKAALKMAGI